MIIPSIVSNPLNVNIKNAVHIKRNLMLRTLWYANIEIMNNNAEKPIINIVKNNVISSILTTSLN